MRRLLYLLPLLLAALVLAGCSGDDDAAETVPLTVPADTTGTTTETTTETTETETTADGESMELKAEVGSSDDPDSYQIYLRDADGNNVTNLPPGQYTIKVEDHSDIHNFHLTGVGVNETTPVEGTGEVEWQVAFAPGDYTFLCDPHPTEMRGSFTVG